VSAGPLNPRGSRMLVSPTGRSRLKPALMACAAGLSLLATPVLAQDVGANRLLELMVTKGLVTRAEADAMIAEAAAAAPTPAAPALAAVPPGGVSGDTQTIPYIPMTVRNQIKAELRAELATQATTEGWARPGEVAEWTRRLTLSGDIRVRGEGVFMDEGNFDLAFPNFGAINAGAGYDISPANPNAAPFLNTTEDRQSARVRARLSLIAQIDDGIAAEVRIATGNDRSPVSTNQTLGADGEFGKYAIWLDRANIRLTASEGIDLVFGRFANPFWTSDILFDDDLNFDGAAVELRSPLGDRLTVFGSFGAFPIFNTDFNFGSNEAGAYASKDKYLLATQAGATFAISDTSALQLAAGYFRFENVQGETSSPCFFDQDVCDTDATRPQFMQLGNSLFPIRDVIPDPLDPVGSPEVQYYGLASQYEILGVHGRLDYSGFGDIGVRLEVDYVRNLGFDRSLVEARAINNLGPGTEVPNPNQDNDPDTDDDTTYNPGPWDGGDTGWMASLTAGKPELAELGDWRVSVGYRWVESDAVLDALADSDFHFGGTNAKGWTVGGGYALGRNTSIGARWLSSDSITGIPYSNDIVQFDLATKF
jgi:hypothetical protein